MKIILLQDVEKLGKAGDVKEVRNGYGLNFLLPSGWAEFATPEALRQAESLVAKRRKELQVSSENFAVQALGLKDKKVIIKTKASNGKLFGSVGCEEIAMALEALGIKLEAKMLEIEKPFKEIGTFPVVARLGTTKTSFEIVIESE
jgi:large subunit ribosomal protein L9